MGEMICDGRNMPADACDVICAEQGLWNIYYVLSYIIKILVPYNC